VVTAAPPPPGVGDDAPPEPLGISPTFPVQAPTKVAAANTTMLQHFMVLTSTGWCFRRAEASREKRARCNCSSAPAAIGSGSRPPAEK